MIVAAAVLYDQATAFPGTAALLPSAGAALFIVAGVNAPLSAPSRLLALPPMRWVGRISYSLYLWHWPLIVIPMAIAGPEGLGLSERLALAALTVPLAWATTRWVEDPVRRGSLARAPTADASAGGRPYARRRRDRRLHRVGRTCGTATDRLGAIGCPTDRRIR
jgi:peptidoglycan/LPS O-acetylase OafA/YrhL